MDWIDKLKAFVRREQDAQNYSIEQMWAKPLPERLAKGEAIAGIEVLPERRMIMEGNRSKLAKVLKIRDNFSKFRVGDTLRLHQGDPSNRQNVFFVEIFKDLETELIVKPAFSERRLDMIVPSAGWILDRDISDLGNMVNQHLDKIKSNSDWYENLEGILQGANLPVFNTFAENKIRQLVQNQSFNPKQAEAFSRAMLSKNYYLIQGPPGTGKTHVLAQIAVHLAKMGKNVLITALTHRAVNNALLKIAKTGYTKVLKIGEFYRADDLQGIVENAEYFTANQKIGDSTEGLIIGASCYSANSKRLYDFDEFPIEFDTVIFDEAGQLTIPVALMAMTRAERSIFIGDHQQMPPIISADHAENWVCKSIFETLFTHAEGTMLDRTYRLCEAINHFPSQFFYKNELRSDISVETARQNFQKNFIPKKFRAVLDPSEAVVFVELPHRNSEMRSVEEAQLIADLIAESLEAGMEAKEIAVIAPFRAQGREIRKKLKQKIQQADFEQIIVDTVERIQGQERDMILISLTCSSPDYLADIAEFYYNPKRLNVAITRPRFKLITVGSAEVFKVRVKDRRLQEWIQIFANFWQTGKKIVV